MSKTLKQCHTIQDIVYQAITSQTSPDSISDLARTWDLIADRQRILRGRPLPGALRPESPKLVRSKPVARLPVDQDLEMPSVQVQSRNSQGQDNPAVQADHGQAGQDLPSQVA